MINIFCFRNWGKSRQNEHMKSRSARSRKTLLVLRRAALLVGAVALVFVATFSASAQGQIHPKAPEKIIGMYVHQHWPYNHPYAARTWTLQDWHGYADGLHQLGYNTFLIWPMLETMPDPLLPSDQANLEKIARVIDMLHNEFGMRVYLVLCPNIVAKNEEAGNAQFEKRHFFYCDTRVNPGDASAMQRMMDWRAKLLAPLSKMDGLVIIDSDPGGYPGSSNLEFVDLLMAHRKVLDKLRPGIELIYWMHAGWKGYGRFYETGDMLTPTTDRERLETLALLKAKNPEPWGLANGLAQATELNVQDRVISFNYGRIEGEPSFPMGNFGGTNAYEGGAAPGPRGVMGNAQTHCIQLPNTFAFVRGARGKTLTERDYVEFGHQLIPGMGEYIVRAWQLLAGDDAAGMRACADNFEKVPERRLRPGPLYGLLFGSPKRFLTDLGMMLRVRAGFCDLQKAESNGADVKAALDEFVTALEAWQHQNGYENSLGWAGLDEALRKLNSPEVNKVLDGRFNPFVPEKLQPGETPFECVARELREEESFTPRLLKALDAARREVK